METPLQHYLIQGELVRILTAGLKEPTCAWVVSDGDGGYLTTIIEARKLRAQQRGKQALVDMPIVPLLALDVKNGNKSRQKLPPLGAPMPAEKPVLVEAKREDVTHYIFKSLGLTRPEAEAVMDHIFGKKTEPLKTEKS